MSSMTVALLLYKLKRPFHFVKTGLLDGFPAELQYGHRQKSLTIYAITGTDGKTTSTSLLAHILQAAGKKVGVVTTVGAKLGDTAIDTGFHVTSPQPSDLYEIMDEMVKQGLDTLVLEITSHGLYQYRDWGIHPQVAGITNITHEHLDYHVTWEEYVKAKGLLLKKSKSCVLPEDDKSYPLLRTIAKNSGTSYTTYSVVDRYHPKIMAAIAERFPEKYNQSNAKLVLKMIEPLDIPTTTLATAIANFTQVPGRMEVVCTKPFAVVVDFAHTPNALENALLSLRNRLDKQAKKGKLIAVFGCAGLRDHTKRPKMGKTSAELADFSIFTAEDPRTENIWSIIRQMKSAIAPHHDRVVSIADRRAAISFALTKMAQPGDIVGIFGKGHEQSMCLGKREHPWDDRRAVREILEIE